jgi:hypothetical protein
LAPGPLREELHRYIDIAGVIMNIYNIDEQLDALVAQSQAAAAARAHSFPVPFAAAFPPSAANAGSEPIPVLPPQVQQELNALLAGLSGTKDNIKNGRKWMADHVSFAAAVCKALEVWTGLLAARVRAQLAPPDALLFLLYLVNDVLIAGAKAREAVNLIYYYSR